jgi:hypothetical protein
MSDPFWIVWWHDHVSTRTPCAPRPVPVNEQCFCALRPGGKFHTFLQPIENEEQPTC